MTSVISSTRAALDIRRRPRWRFGVVATALMALLVSTACGGGDPQAADAGTAGGTQTATEPSEHDDGDTHESEDAHESESTHESAGFGEPASAEEADRVIEVNVDNDLRFEPDTFEVVSGEVVTFRVTNTGDVEHELVIGDEQAQQAMAEQMAESATEGDGHGHSGEMGNAVTVHAGETAELTWRFADPGTVLIGCHVQGHYEAGMDGTITVS